MVAAALIADLAFGPSFLASSTAPSTPTVPRPHLQTHVTAVDGLQVKAAPFSLHSIPLAKRWPYFRAYTHHAGARSADGVPRYVAPDGRTYPHPVAAAQYGLHEVAIGNRSRALAAGRALLAQAVAGAGNALWLPYRFPFPLYGNAAKTLQPPWYSAMAQGEALNLFTALGQLTGDRRWRKAADAVFASFRINTHRIVQRDARGYLWLEEYPHDGTGERVFNGHLFAVLGLIHYHLATGRGGTLIDAALTTAEHYASKIRNKGGISSYSLANQTDRSAKYHHVHIVLLRTLARITGKLYFRQAADEFQSDARFVLPRGV
jgi:hypothetical protein